MGPLDVSSFSYPHSVKLIEYDKADPAIVLLNCILKEDRISTFGQGYYSGDYTIF